MRVVHLSTDDVTGGAARCAARLHTGLRDVGVDSTMLVDRRRGRGEHVVAFQHPEGLLGRRRMRKRKRAIRTALDPYAGTRPAGYEPFNADETPYGAAPFLQVPPCDVVNLHWVARFVDVEGLMEWMTPGLPVVWTLHDMHLLTGGCHYDDGCGRFESGCGQCPQLGSADPADLSHRMWERKRSALEALPAGVLEIVTPSGWLAEEARRSGVIPSHVGVRVIPYGLDTECFAPTDRLLARQRFDVPADAPVVLFVAQSVENRRKGFHLLSEALQTLGNVDGLCLVSVGKGEPTLEGSTRSRHLGEIRSDRDMAEIYGMADVFCVPSLQDNLPATVLESLACGTPVVGFPIGGIPDMVRAGRTGELAKESTGPALADAIARALDFGGTEMRERCRRTAVAEYPLALQATRYKTLYAELLAAGSRAALPAVSVS